MREMRAARSGKRTAKPGAPFFLVPACPPPATPLPSFSSPIVGMVVTISPSFSLYRMVVLPAASSPTWGGKGEGVGAREGKREQKKTVDARRARAKRGDFFFRAGATGGTVGPFHPSGAADRHDAHATHGAGGEGRGRGCAGGARREEARRAHAPPSPCARETSPPPQGTRPRPPSHPASPLPLPLTIRIRISFLENSRANSLVKVSPIFSFFGRERSAEKTKKRRKKGVCGEGKGPGKHTRGRGGGGVEGWLGLRAGRGQTGRSLPVGGVKRGGAAERESERERGGGRPPRAPSPPFFLCSPPSPLRGRGPGQPAPPPPHTLAWPASWPPWTA